MMVTVWVTVTMFWNGGLSAVTVWSTATMLWIGSYLQ